MTLDTGQVFSFKAAQSSLFWGMSKGQESKFLAIFDKLYSSSGPQKPGYESGHKSISLGAKNKVPMFFHIERYLDFSYRINF